MADGRKAFHFDLDEAKLKALYPSDSENGYKNAWAKIRAFMERNDFTHTQYSGYESNYGLSYYDAYVVIDNLQETLPWFRDCAKAATLTEISRRHDVLEYLAETQAQDSPSASLEVPGSLRGEAERMGQASKALERDGSGIDVPTKTGRER